MTGDPGHAAHAAGIRGASRALRVAIPWLTRAVAQCAGGEGLEAAGWLAARANPVPVPVDGWRDWLLEDAEAGPAILEQFPAGPCIRAAQTEQIPRGTWACVTPVHLLTAIDHLQMAPPGAIVLEPDEMAAIGATLREHFSASDFTFLDDGCGSWLWASSRETECTSVEPAVAVGRNVRDAMPAGRDGLAVRKLMNEIQMLLHEHPVNERRVARGERTVNSLWLWGFGTARVSSSRLPQLFSNDRWLQGLARLHGAGCGSPLQLGQWLSSGTDGIAVGWADVGPSTTPRDVLLDIERTCFRPARDALIRGLVDRVDLLLGGRCLHATRRDRWRFWRGTRSLADLLP